MQFKSLALLTLSATGAVATQQEKRQIVPTDPVGVSVLSVLATAIPQDIASMALTNPLALSSQLASSISAGQTPSWYQALPSDVKNYLPKLFPASTAASATPSNTNPVSSAISSAVSSAVSSALASASASLSSALNTTTISTVKSATLPASSASGSSGTASSSRSSGGAAYPTAVVGAGVAGAIGFLGMLAL